jgi:hypothetical protein
MKLVNNLLRGNTDRADEKGSFLFDDDIDDLWELSLEVVVLFDARSVVRTPIRKEERTP